MANQTTNHALPKDTHGLEKFRQSYDAAMDIIDDNLLPEVDTERMTRARSSRSSRAFRPGPRPDAMTNAPASPLNAAADPRRWVWRRSLVYLTNIASFLLFWRVVETDAAGIAVQALVGSLTLLLTAQNLAYIFAPSLEAGWGVIERGLAWITRRGDTPDDTR